MKKDEDNNEIEEDTPYINTYSCINKEKGGYLANKSTLYFKKIVKISSGDGFSVCVDSEGSLYSWGKSAFGQLGYDLVHKDSLQVEGTNCQPIPKRIYARNAVVNKVIDVSCGKDFVFLLDDQGIPYSFGHNNHGQLARDCSMDWDSSVDVATHLVEDKKTYLKVCCGWAHGAALERTGDVYYWGNPYADYNKQIQGIHKPIKVPLGGQATDLASGFHHLAAICNVNNQFELFTWGVNNYVNFLY